MIASSFVFRFVFCDQNHIPRAYAYLLLCMQAHPLKSRTKHRKMDSSYCRQWRLRGLKMLLYQMQNPLHGMFRVHNDSTPASLWDGSQLRPGCGNTRIEETHPQQGAHRTLRLQNSRGWQMNFVSVCGLCCSWSAPF